MRDAPHISLDEVRHVFADGRLLVVLERIDSPDEAGGGGGCHGECLFGLAVNVSASVGLGDIMAGFRPDTFVVSSRRDACVCCDQQTE